MTATVTVTVTVTVTQHSYRDRRLSIVTVTLWEGVFNDAPLLFAYFSLPEDEEQVRGAGTSEKRSKTKIHAEF